MTLQEAAGGTCFCAGMVLYVQGHGSLTEAVGTVAASHQLKDSGMGPITTFVLAPGQQQATNWKLQKLKDYKNTRKAAVV